MLSSSWRAWEHSRLKVALALSEYGLSYQRWTTTAELTEKNPRAAQILRFVSDEGAAVAQWAVVDDEELVTEEDQHESMMLMVGTS